MDKLTSVKVRNNDGTYQEEIPIGTQARYVVMNNGQTVEKIVGNINVGLDGDIATQLLELKQCMENSFNNLAQLLPHITCSYSTELNSFIFTLNE